MTEYDEDEILKEYQATAEQLKAVFPYRVSSVVRGPDEKFLRKHASDVGMLVALDRFYQWLDASIHTSAPPLPFCDVRRPLKAAFANKIMKSFVRNGAVGWTKYPFHEYIMAGVNSEFLVGLLSSNLRLHPDVWSLMTMCNTLLYLEYLALAGDRDPITGHLVYPAPWRSTEWFSPKLGAGPVYFLNDGGVALKPTNYRPFSLRLDGTQHVFLRSFTTDSIRRVTWVGD